MRRLPLLLISPLLACTASEDPSAQSDTSSASTSFTSTADAPTTSGQPTTDPTEGLTTGDVPTDLHGHCAYQNVFSKQEECREYIGAGWTDAETDADCLKVMGTGASGPCDYPSILGTCDLPGEPDAYQRLVFPGTDPGQCQATQTGCELFAGGTFEPSPLCEDPNPPADPNASVFQWPTLECRDPLNGEPPGMGEGGQVCTWTMISGCTEPGRKFTEYGACEPVLTQRPYYPVPAAPPPAEPDLRLDDPVYAAEQAWVTEQVEACACVCCHQNSITPKGASVWDIEGQGNWLNTFSPYGLAFTGGFLDSSLLGAYPAADNNGFDRTATGIPTTDVARMQAFFAAELEHRGFTPEDFAGQPPTPKIFYDQAIYEPGPCDADQRIDLDGTIRWTGGAARYVYVLAADADNPGVPPNLDLPSGTAWRLDVDTDATAIASGSVRYGQLVPATTQGFPEVGQPPALQSKQSYYLYVLADIGVPITRCLFTAP